MLTVVGVQTWPSPMSILNQTIPLPAGVLAGDLLLAFVSYPSYTPADPSTSSTGWTRVTFGENGYVTTALFAKTATGSDPLVVSAGTTRYMDAVVYCIRGAAGYAANSAAGMGGTATAPTVTLGASANFTALAVIGISTPRTVTAWPPNYGDHYATPVAGSHCAIHAASRAGLSGTSVSPGTWSLSSTVTYFAAITVAVLDATAVETDVRLPGPLGTPTLAGTIIPPVDARATLAGPLGTPTLTGAIIPAPTVWATLPGPLGTPSLVGTVITPPQVRAHLSGPLGTPRAVARRLARVHWTHTAPATLQEAVAVYWTHRTRARLPADAPVWWTHRARASIPADAPVWWSHTAPAGFPVAAPVWWTRRTRASLLPAAVPVWWSHTARARLPADAPVWWTHTAPAALAPNVTRYWWTHTAPAGLVSPAWFTHAAPAELLAFTPVWWTHLAPTTLLASDVDLITDVPVLTYPGGTCIPLQITLTCAEDSPAWLADLQLDDLDVVRAIRIGDPLTLTLHGTPYALCCDGITTARTPAAPTLTVKASSPVLQLGRAWAAPVALGTGLAHAVVERLLGQTVTWDLVDWRLPASVAALEDAPLELARAIIAAVRGRLESRPDGSLVARPQHPLNAPDYPTAAGGVALTDRHLVETRETLDDSALYNRFTIRGATPAESAIQLESIVDPTTATAYTLYAYPYPWRPITIVHTGDAQTVLGGLTEQTLPRRELIEIRAGAGSVAYPVATLRGWDYQHQDLGAVHADGNQITTTQDGYSLVWIDYDTRAWVATATNQVSETIQFLATE